MIAELKAAPAAAAEQHRTARVWLVSHSSALRGALGRRMERVMAPGRPNAQYQDGAGVAGCSPPHLLVLDAEVSKKQTAEVVAHIQAAWPRTQMVVVALERQSLGNTSALPSNVSIIRCAGVSTLTMRKAADDILDLLPSASSLTSPSNRMSAARGGFAALVVASSTGGPDALREVFTALKPQDAKVPILIVQHMPPSFTPMLAAQLRELGWDANEGKHGETPLPGTISIAPGGRHMGLTGKGGALNIKLSEDEPINYCKPSADVLFASAGAVLGPRVLSLVLTGMGNDGGEGAKLITATGGSVLAQDKASSVVWGMPGAVVQGGAAHKVLPLSDIAGKLRSALATGRL